MTIRRLSLAALAFSAVFSAAAASPRVADTGCGIAVDLDSVRVEIQMFTPSTMRVVKTPAGAATPEPGYAITARADSAVPYTVSPRGRKCRIMAAGAGAEIDTSTGEIALLDGRGRRMLRERGAASFGEATDMGAKAMSAAQSFALEPGEAIYGLGNLANGQLSQRGITRTLMPGNIEDGIPALQSVKGYGLYWDNYSPTTFSDSDEATTFASPLAEAVDYYFMMGDGTPDGVTSQMRAISGRVPMMPLWTYGFWQSRERYKSQDETCGVVARYREIGVPLDGIIQDWQYWGNNYLWNAMEFMNPEFPRPQEMIDSIHAMNAHAIISIWSSFGPATKPYAELAQKNLLFDISTWPQSGIAEQWPPRMDYPSGVRVYNCYSPEARDIYWNHLRRIHAMGMDGWWMDSTEPDHFDDFMDFDTGAGSFRRVRGAYPLLTVGGVYDHQTAEDTTRRVFILTRSAWFGQQRTGSNVWTGDVASTWDMLRKQVPSQLNFSMTGNPNTNSDLGGFFCGHYNRPGRPAHDNPLFRELVVRWTQMGVFTPMMRSHGADCPREIYRFGSAGEPVFDALAAAVRLRYSLLPYIYSTAWLVSDADASFMRPVGMDFPADKRTHDLAAQYMFGPSLLVAPVLEAKYTSESQVDIDENSGWNRDAKAASGAEAVDFTQPRTATVYLPAGTDWYNFFTGERHKGGRMVQTDASLAATPVFARAGSIVPLGPDVQYAKEKPWTELTLRVFPGADGSFTLYEDEGDGYGYTRGERSTIAMHYDHATRTLRIGAREGAFPGMPGSRTFNVVDASTGRARTVAYDGSPVELRL